MNPMSPKVTGKKVCLQAKGPIKLLKDLGPKRCPNTWRKEESKEIKDFMKEKKKKVYIVKDIMVVTQSNELKFQRLFEHHPF
jgi:hypothetical protein